MNMHGPVRITAILVSLFVSGCAAPAHSPPLSSSHDSGSRWRSADPVYLNVSAFPSRIVYAQVPFRLDKPDPTAGWRLTLTFPPNSPAGYVWYSKGWWTGLGRDGKPNSLTSYFQSAFVPAGTHQLRDAGGLAPESAGTYAYGLVLAGTIPFNASYAFGFGHKGEVLPPRFPNASADMLFRLGDKTHFDPSDPTHPNVTTLDVDVGRRDFGLFGFQYRAGPIEDGQEIKFTHWDDSEPPRTGAFTAGNAYYRLDPPAPPGTPVGDLFLSGHSAKAFGKVHIELDYRGTGEVWPMVFAATYDPQEFDVELLKSLGP